MNEFTDFRAQFPVILKTLAVGIPAGYLFHRLHAPIPWMIGPMIAVATLNLMGVRMDWPPFARQMGQVILGSAVSLYFTPTVVAALGANFPAIMAATVAVFLVGGIGALTLSRASGVDGKSTFFASVAVAAILAWAFGLPIATMIIATSPGGLAEMTILAQALQISVPLVIAFHLFRVVMVNLGTQYIYAWAVRLLGGSPNP